jgi:hypothetical protein
VRQAILGTSDILVAGEERLRDGLVVEVTLISAIANLCIQRWVLFVTLLTIAIGVVAIIVAVRQSA